MRVWPGWWGGGWGCSRIISNPRWRCPDCCALGMKCMQAAAHSGTQLQQRRHAAQCICQKHALRHCHTLPPLCRVALLVRQGTPLLPAAPPAGERPPAAGSVTAPGSKAGTASSSGDSSSSSGGDQPAQQGGFGLSAGAIAGRRPYLPRVCLLRLIPLAGSVPACPLGCTACAAACVHEHAMPPEAGPHSRRSVELPALACLQA